MPLCSRFKITNSNFLKYFLIFFVAFYLFFILQTVSQTLLCPDSFYHAKMASFLAEGRLIKNFPWLPYTIFSHSYIDHHFLYHLLLIPFVTVFYPLFGIKIATAFFASITIVVFYWFLKKFKMKFPFLWTFLLITSSVFLTRLNLAKVPAAAIPVLLLGLAALFKRKYVLLSIMAFTYVWLYNTWPILVVAVFIYCFASALKKIIENWELFKSCPDAPLISVNKNKEVGIPTLRREKLVIGNFLKYLFAKENIGLILSCFFGIICGLVINPYFPQNIYFDWIHIVQIGLKNYQGILPVGAEWYSYDPIHLIFDNPLILLPWLISIGWLVFSLKKREGVTVFGQSVKSISLSIFSLLFFIYTMKSRRNVDYFIPIATLACAFSFNNQLSNLPWRSYFNEFKKFTKDIYLNLVTAILGLSVLTLLIFSGVSLYKDVWLAKKSEFGGGANFNRFQGAADFLKENVRPDEIIFHSSWDEFPALFYHNDQNYYIAGLDPTFSYEENKPLYWLWFNIVTARQNKNLAQVIKNKFNSRYVFIKADRKELKKNFDENYDFEKIFEDSDGSVYKIR